ncbi:MAG: hypothetical protein JSS02_34730 [Planctomycetes bacterium]|nr:hypothetical protein [Planctomycetota bacterium]
MWRRMRWTVLVLAGAVSAGCGGADEQLSVSGGTTGKIHNGGEPLFGIQVTVYLLDGDAVESLGVASSQPDGSFELVTMDGTEACQLPPGEYRCTLESVGTPCPIPPDFTQPETTPLKIVLTAEGQPIDLDLPQLRNDS